MKRLIYILMICISALVSKAQCPQIYDYMGVLQTKPYWISCTGGAYTINFQSNSSWGPYTINWGDGTPNTVGAGYTANTIINHNYAATIDTFVVTLTIPSLNCTVTGVVVMEKPVNASIQIPLGGVTQACAPKALQFINSSTDVSKTTKFEWNFGDGTPPVPYTYTNGGAVVTHTYNKGTVNCQTQVTLKAWNYCSFSNTTIANFNPIQIYDIDNAAITPDAFIKCWPDNVFTFSNTTQRNCLAQGNTFQRQEWWNFGNYWGLNHDSIINWKPWPPTLPHSIAYPSVGSYTVMLRDSNLCGVDTAIITVSILNPPNAGISAPPGPLCQNTAITFTNTSGPGYFYKWNFGAGGGFVTAPFGPQTYTYASPGTYTVKLVAYIPGAPNSCSDTDMVVVNILPSPVANFNHAPTSGCNSLSNVVFTDASINAVAWNWNFGNGNTSVLQAPPSQNYSSVGMYTITLQVTGTNTCKGTKTSTVQVYPIPVPAFIPLSTCVGSATQFTNQSTSSATLPITSYTWNFGDGSSNAFVQNPIHTYTAANTYTVKLIVANAQCKDSIVNNVIANVKPSAGFNYTPTAGCPTLNVTFTNTSFNGINYLWNFGTIPTNTSSVANPSFAFTNTTAASVNYTVTLFATTGFGCGDSIKKVVTVNPKPISNYTANLTPGCSPLPVNFTNTATGATTYTWTFGDGNFSNALNTSHTYTNNSLLLQTYTASLISENSFGCRDTISKLVTIYPKPLFSFTMIPASGCTPLNVSFPSVLGAVSYTWNFGDGSPVSNASSPTHIFTNTTTVTKIYTVTLIATNAFGCSDTTTGNPIVYPKPIPNYSANPTSGCSPLTVTFTNSSTGNNSSAWDFNNGQASIQTNPVITFTNAPGNGSATYQIKLVVGNANGCTDSVVKPVTLFPRPFSKFDLDTPACSPKTLSFTNLSQGAVSYTWNFGGSNTSTLTNASYQFINNTTSNQFYVVSLTAKNSNNCTDTSKVVLVVHPKPKFFISALPDSGCTPLKVTFPVIVGVANYQWIFGDGNSSTTASVSNVYINNTSANKIFTVQLIGKDAYGCADTTYRNIKVFPKPSAFFKADPLTVFVPNGPTTMYNLSTGATTYTWSFGDGTGSNQNSPSHTYLQAGEYQIVLVAMSNKGCRDTFFLPSKLIAMEESFFEIPNAFTPNTNGSPGSVFDPKDMSNDIFHPNIRGVEKYRFSIYSRWGELLFDTRDVNEGWDGYYKGKLCTQDVYVWKITATMIDGKTVNKTGDVMLLR